MKGKSKVVEVNMLLDASEKDVALFTRNSDTSKWRVITRKNRWLLVKALWGLDGVTTPFTEGWGWKRGNE